MNDFGKLFGEGRESPEDEELMSAGKTELDYLGIQIGIKGGITIQNNAVRRKYFKYILNSSVRGLTTAFKY